jgi:hypothetical protein
MPRSAACLLFLLPLAGCGVQSPDLFALTRTGALPDARVTLVLTDDGFVKCGPKEKGRVLPDRLLLDARELKRRAADDATANRRFPRRAGSQLSYTLRSQDGTVRWSDTSRPLPSQYFLLALLARRIGKGVCGLRR